MAESTSTDGEGRSSPAPGSSERPTPLIRDNECVFCQIVSKEFPTEILYEDAEFVCFRDIEPDAPHHYQVIPRTHIKNAKSLTRDHVPMVERMAKVGEQVLSQQGANVQDSRIGFHWPPFVQINHLHMHLLSPVAGMSWLKKSFSFKQDSFKFVTVMWLVDYLKKLKPKAS